MRYIYQGTYKDGSGRVIESGTITIYEAGTITAVDVYVASAGGSAVNSVTSDSDGDFAFYVDDSDYTSHQLFDITLSKTGYGSNTYSDIDILKVYHADIITKGPQVDVRAFGATGDGVTDDSASIQEAIDYIVANGGGTVFFPTGVYKIGTQLDLVNSGLVGINLVGLGGHASVLESLSTTVPSSGCMINMNTSGPACKISNLAIQSALGGNRSINGINITGSGNVLDSLWISGFANGLSIDTASNLRISNIQTELNYVGYQSTNTMNIVFVDCHSYQDSILGFQFYGTKSISGSESLGNITMTACSIVECGTGVYIDTNIPVIISSTEITSFNNIASLYGIKIVSTSGNVDIIGVDISHMKIAGIYSETNTFVSIVGGVISRIGYYDQTIPWAAYGIYKPGNAGSLIVSGTKIIDCAGYGIHTSAIFNQLSSVLFSNCTQGGSDAGGVNATTGNTTLYVDPLANYLTLEMTGCFLDAPAGSGTGKTGMYINNTAAPVANNIKMIGNGATANAFATPFGTALTNAQLATHEIIANNNFTQDTPKKVGTWADSEAPNSTLYYSSTASKLVWKDSGGTSNLLYGTTLTAGITADTGSSQGDGPLTSQYNEISVCVNAGDAVTLPSAVAKLKVTIMNNGAQSCDVFPASGDDCGGGADTAVALAAGSNITYFAYDSTNWEAI